MKTTHFIIAICAALGVFAAGRLSLSRSPQPQKPIVVSPSATFQPHPNQSAVVQNGNDTLRVAGTASLVPAQPASTSSPHP